MLRYIFRVLFWVWLRIRFRWTWTGFDLDDELRLRRIHVLYVWESSSRLRVVRCNVDLRWNERRDQFIDVGTVPNSNYKTCIHWWKFTFVRNLSSLNTSCCWIARALEINCTMPDIGIYVWLWVGFGMYWYQCVCVVLPPHTRRILKKTFQFPRCYATPALWCCCKVSRRDAQARVLSYSCGWWIWRGVGGSDCIDGGCDQDWSSMMVG